MITIIFNDIAIIIIIKVVYFMSNLRNAYFKNAFCDQLHSTMHDIESAF